MLVGLLNGVFIARFKLPSFMMTLVTLMFFSSAAIWITQSQNIVNLPESFTQLGSGDIVSFYFGEKLTPEIKRRDILPFVTYPMLISLALAIAAHLLLSRTVFGRHVYAVGNNPRAAEISGVPVRRTIIARLRHRRASAPRSPPSSIRRGSRAGARRSAAARRCSTSSARR